MCITISQMSNFVWLFRTQIYSIYNENDFIIKDMIPTRIYINTPLPTYTQICINLKLTKSCDGEELIQKPNLKTQGKMNRMT